MPALTSCRDVHNISCATIHWLMVSGTCVPYVVCAGMTALLHEFVLHIVSLVSLIN